MFDPTIFENLKVAVENVVYDLDNLDERILVTGRTDRMDMAVMSRAFSLKFELVPRTGAEAEIRLEAFLKDLAAELLETPGEQPGCALSLRFYTEVRIVPEQCRRISELMQVIWEPQLTPVQTLSCVYGEDPIVYKNTIELKFPHKINEDNMSDIPNLVEHMIRTLEGLAQL
ncbi:hypothetical protein MNQ98_23925 [Paenibacillus sp. N3/727]|uniref:hypothetical protein n=1 Tax=Paenibacillus sp. N3/727 TaxID=2925845 RepID=UPI001F5303C6|nr:hypothetical protein [Paenibacillus sp. N3/727]UNK17488.1 hypothetical protein MNQ98_23925 [Paenibacillus sp. N3/727]